MEHFAKKPNMLLRRALGSSLLFGTGAIEAGSPFLHVSNSGAELLGLVVIAFAIILVVAAFGAYFVSTSWQGGLDKKLVDLKVVFDDGSPLTFSTAYAREIIFMSPILIIFFSIKIAAIVFILWYIVCPIVTKGKKCFHDVIAQTKVIDKDDGF
ncbi:MAG: RDD family protein [Alphaproteobacteria bacterium]|nr:RDD family protein [Alphaproteobacteria bacterium]